MGEVMRFYGYVPNYCTEVNLPSFDFETLDQLKAHEWIRSAINRKEFHRLSTDENKIMVEFDGGTKWYVLGSIDGNISELGIPIWRYQESMNLKKE
jgi:hypothetical protein